MLFMAAFLAPALALSPVGKGEAAVPPAAMEVSVNATEPPVEARRQPAPGWLVADAWRQDQEARQVRIRQEIMVRVSPRRSRELVANWRTVLPQRYEQRKIGKCLTARNIVAVQTVSSRDLVLYMADSRMIRAQLNKACNARDFYLGFYIEPNDDGELCVDRDMLRSRNGASCKIGGIRQLVPTD